MEPYPNSHPPTSVLGSTGEYDWPLLASVFVERQECLLNIQQVKPVKTLESDLVWIRTSKNVHPGKVPLLRDIRCSLQQASAWTPTME